MGKGAKGRVSEVKAPSRQSLCGSPKITKSISLQQAPRGSHCPGQSSAPRSGEALTWPAGTDPAGQGEGAGVQERRQEGLGPPSGAVLRARSQQGGGKRKSE